MKIIGIAGDRYDSEYVCTVSHKEIEKFLDLYYNKMEKPKVGDEIDLGKGHDFYQQTQNALKKTQEFLESNAAVVNAIISGIKVLSIDHEEANE